MTGIFYIIEQEVIMAKLIGFSENFRGRLPTFKISDLTEIKPYLNPFTGSLCSYIMIHDGPEWSIGYQQEVRFYMDDGTTIDFTNDCNGQIEFLRNYIDSNKPRKFEIASEVEFMDI